jgi:hypothetical protein
MSASSGSAVAMEVLAFLRENIHFVLEIGMLLLLAYTLRMKPKKVEQPVVLSASVRRKREKKERIFDVVY